MAAMKETVVLSAFWLLLSTSVAGAYTCRVSPAGDAVTIKTGNNTASAVSCTVTCRFMTPQGLPFDVTCTQTIPANTPDWYVCVRPTGGKAVGAFEDGEEKCAKPPVR
jgi:hypothetical protein